MKWTPSLLASAICIGGASAPLVAYSKIYLSVEQAQKAMFGNVAMENKPVVISPQVQEMMRDASSVSHPFQSNRIWRSSHGDWFIVDEVVGKHEMITYAIGINPNGTIKQIDVLEYKESYGDEVALPSWKDQFIGKTVNSTLKLNKDIQNVSGATLSAKHMTDGVKRVMVMYDQVLKNLK